MRTCGVRVLLVWTEPGSGGCLDALNRWGTQRARIAPTPRPPVDGRNAAPQTPLRMDGVCEAWSGIHFTLDLSWKLLD